MAGDLGFDDAWVAKSFDHIASKKQEQVVPSVTGNYNHPKRMKEKRGALDGVAAELRRIIGKLTGRAGK